MTQPRRRKLSLLIATLLVVWVLPGVQGEDLGRKRIQRADGTWVTGEVQETADAYVVQVTKNITVTIYKNEVRAILPAEEAESQPGQKQEESENPDPRGGVRDAEIEKLLEGTGLEPPVSELALEEGELPLDEESVAEMQRAAGTDNMLVSKHVVIVYTSTEAGAKQLAYRLEAIWRWRMRFMSMLKLPVRLPAHKLELFYFATREEFDAVCTILYGHSNPGAWGFFMPSSNRSHFYDVMTDPPVKRRLEAAKKMKLADRIREENLAKLWSEYNNVGVTQHELGHHIDFNVGLFPRYAYLDIAEKGGASFDAMPRWLIEGTTMMFEVPPTSEGASLGAVNYERVEQFHRLYPKRPSPEWMKSFIVDNGVWLSGGGFFYPMGWAIVYYLWEEKRPGLVQYYHIITAREPGDTVSYTQRLREFEDCFGKVDKKWMEDFWDYIKAIPRRPSLLPPEGYPYK
jgi:hypothetical protein